MKATTALANILPEAQKIDQRRLTFTMVSNYLLDVIIPEIAGDPDCLCPEVACLILVMIERKTVGFHRDTAVVSIPEMMEWTGASESTVKRARRYLISKGYLVVVRQGNGYKKSVYALNFAPDPPVDNPVDKPVDNIIHLPAGVNSGNNADQDPAIPETNPADQKNEYSGSPFAKDETRKNDVAVFEDQASPEARSSIIPPSPEAQSPEKPSEIEGVHRDPPQDSSGNIILSGGSKKTNTESAEERKKATANVCHIFRRWGFKVTPDNWAFIAWCVKTYGIEAVDHKLNILKCQLLRGVKFANVFGWLRYALSRDYQYSKRDAAKMKAELSAKIAIERSKMERERLDREREEWLKNWKPDTADKFAEMLQNGTWRELIPNV